MEFCYDYLGRAIGATFDMTRVELQTGLFNFDVGWREAMDFSKHTTSVQVSDCICDIVRRIGNLQFTDNVKGPITWRQIVLLCRNCMEAPVVSVNWRLPISPCHVTSLVLQSIITYTEVLCFVAVWRNQQLQTCWKHLSSLNKEWQLLIFILTPYNIF